MNNVTKEKTAMSLLQACSEEGVTYKEAARIFNTEPAYFKMLEREDKRGAIPEKVMDRFHSWVYSGQTLKEYKMPKNFEEERQLTDACLVNRMNEEMGALLMAGERVTLPYPSEEPRIKVKTEALAKRKKELAEKKPRKKYTRKPKENTPDYAKAIRESRPASTICDYVIKRTTPEVTQKILDDAPVPAHKYVAEAVPEGTPFVSIPEQKIDAIGLLWLKICPERQMIDAASIQSIADECDVPFGFVKEVIEREIANDQELIDHIMEQTKEVVVSPFPQSEESELDLLKSEVKTLAFLLQMEHEDNERLRAEVGYLNARIAYKAKQADNIIQRLRNEIHKTSVECTNQRSYYYEAMLEDRKKENDELEDAFRKLKNRTLWERILNKGVK